jgi:hypothetical protein
LSNINPSLRPPPHQTRTKNLKTPFHHTTLLKLRSSALRVNRSLPSLEAESEESSIRSRLHQHSLTRRVASDRVPRVLEISTTATSLSQLLWASISGDDLLLATAFTGSPFGNCARRLELGLLALPTGPFAAEPSFESLPCDRVKNSKFYDFRIRHLTFPLPSPLSPQLLISFFSFFP